MFLELEIICLHMNCCIHKCLGYFYQSASKLEEGISCIVDLFPCMLNVYETQRTCFVNHETDFTSADLLQGYNFILEMSMHAPPLNLILNQKI